MTRSRMHFIELFRKIRIITTGNNFDSGRIYMDLDVPEAAELIPHADELTLFTLGEEMTTLVKWGVYFRSGYTRSFEGSPILIGAAVAGGANESKRHTPYTTLIDFNLDSRLMIGYGNVSGTAFESGIASATLAIRTVGI